MGNGQLKPAYNVQAATNAEYIVGIMTSEKCTDTPTLIPFLKQLKENLGYEYEKIVADAGYESEENYIFRRNRSTFIKPINYEK